MKRIIDGIRQNALLLGACVVFAYAVLTLLFTYPLIAQFTTHNAGSHSDEMQWLWNYWSVKRAVVDEMRNPFFTDFVYYPYKIGLSFHAYAFLNGLLGLPLHGLLGLAGVFNLFVMLSYVLTGLGTYLLVDYLVEDKRAAFLAGALFAFSPYHMVHVAGNLNNIQWVPFYTLFLIRALDGQSPVKTGPLAGLFLGLTFLSDYYYFVFLCILGLGLVAYYLAAVRVGVWRVFRIFVLLALAASPFILPVLFFAYQDVSDFQFWGSMFREGSRGSYALEPLNLVVPFSGNFFLGWLSYPLKFTREHYGYLGLTAMCLALVGWTSSRRKVRLIFFWSFAFVIFTLLSFGDSLHVLGKKLPIPLPFALFSWVPLLENLRAPTRFNIMSMFCIVVLAAYGLKRILSWRRYAALFVLPLSFIDSARIPFPTNPVQIPPVYHEIARDAEARSVLDVPFFVMDGFVELGRPHPASLLYQTVHQKKIFNGYVSRAPLRVIFSYLNVPVIRSILLTQRNVAPREEVLLVDRKVSREFIELFGVDYLVVHKKFGLEGTRAMLESLADFEHFYEDTDIAVYRTHRAKDGLAHVDVGTERSIPYLQRGWINGQMKGETTFAWMHGEESLMLINLPEKDYYALVFRLMPHALLSRKEVSVSLNGALLGTLPLSGAWAIYEVPISPEAVRAGINRVTFESADSLRSAEDVQVEWTRGALTEFTRKVPVPGLILDWEQDNERLRNQPISIAVDFVAVEKRLGASVPQD